MKIQKIIVTGVLSLLTLSLFAQTALQKRGDRLFNKYSYSKAIEVYEKISKKRIGVKRNLATAYYNLSDFKKAEEWSKEVVEMTGFTAEDVYKYAYVLRINRKYKESENWMDQYYRMNSTDGRAREVQRKKGLYKTLKEDKRQFEAKNLRMNGPAQEFGTSYYKDLVVFTSSRGLGKTRVWGGNNQPFLNLYQGQKQADLELDKIKQFHKKENQKWHEGPATFNADGTFMAFTRNNYKGKSADDIKKLMLFTSSFENGVWSKPEGVPFNSSEYSVGQASLSADGKTMYFASDMPGGYGGIDIYKTIREGNSWSAPINLGPVVNTEGREMFPFINHESKILFYASDGHYGLGGLDVFMSNVNGDKYGESQNLGYPINTSYDDFAFVVDKDVKTGYFSSNRIDGKGDDDIYSFKMLKPFCKTLRGTTKDQATQDLLANVKVGLYNKDGELIEYIMSNTRGEYEFCISEGEVYGLKGEKKNYSTAEESANMSAKDKEVVVDLYLAQMTLYVKVTDEERGTSLSDVKCTLVSCEGKEEVYYSSASGDFRKAIQRKLNEQECFSILYEKEGYIEKEIQYDFLIDRVGEYKIEEQLRPVLGVMTADNDGIIKSENEGNIEDEININPIYFDLDRYDIRFDAKVELNKIVALMTKYPDMHIELSSHTDCRANRKYNQILSSNRAKASLNYIRDRISNPSRITGKGYGETRLMNDCVCEPDNYSPCSEAQHQENRRTDFVIISQ